MAQAGWFLRLEYHREGDQHLVLRTLKERGPDRRRIGLRLRLCKTDEARVDDGGVF